MLRVCKILQTSLANCPWKHCKAATGLANMKGSGNVLALTSLKTIVKLSLL